MTTFHTKLATLIAGAAIALSLGFSVGGAQAAVATQPFASATGNAQMLDIVYHSKRHPYGRYRNAVGVSCQLPSAGCSASRRIGD